MNSLKNVVTPSRSTSTTTNTALPACPRPDLPPVGCWEICQRTGIWPGRPDCQDFSASTHKESQYRLPEINVPDHQIYLCKATRSIRFSSTVTAKIRTRVDDYANKTVMLEAQTSSLISRIMKSIPCFKNDASNAMMAPVEIWDYEIPRWPPSHTEVLHANVHFPECIIDEEDESESNGMISITGFAAEKMLEHAIIYIDENHHMLEDFAILCGAKLPKVDEQYANLLDDLVFNCRWIWITRCHRRQEPVGPQRSAPGSSKFLTPLITLSSGINLQMLHTANLYDARTCYFKSRTKLPREPLRQFCLGNRNIGPHLFNSRYRRGREMICSLVRGDQHDTEAFWICGVKLARYMATWKAVQTKTRVEMTQLANAHRRRCINPFGLKAAASSKEVKIMKRLLKKKEISCECYQDVQGGVDRCVVIVEHEEPEMEEEKKHEERVWKAKLHEPSCLLGIMDKPGKSKGKGKGKAPSQHCRRCERLGRVGRAEEAKLYLSSCCFGVPGMLGEGQAPASLCPRCYELDATYL